MSPAPLAILGASSWLALDFVATTAADERLRFSLYARRPDAVRAALAKRGTTPRGDILPIERFGDLSYSASSTSSVSAIPRAWPLSQRHFRA